MEQRLNRLDYGPVRESLREAGFNSATDLLSTYAARLSDLREWMQGAEINRQRNLRLQYLAGLGLNNNAAGPIYDQVLGYARFPADIFIGSASSIARLRALFHHRRY